jgi:hypothetical protein
MGATQPYAGYVGQVWRTAYASLTWLSGIMAAADNSPSVVANPALIVYQTLRNAVDAVSAYSMSNAWLAEIKALQGIQVLPLTLDAGTAAFFNARIATYVAAQAALAALLPAANPAGAAVKLAMNSPAIADMGLLGFYVAFNYEAPPSPITTPVDFTAAGQAAATAWGTVATAISVLQGATITQAYDTAIRQFNVAQTAVNTVTSFVNPVTDVDDQILLEGGEITVDGDGDPITDGGDYTGLWNPVMVLPAIVMDGSLTCSAPFSVVNQQSGVIRYALITMLNQLAFLLLSLRQPAIGVVNLGALLNNDTLMDFAARETGNFENWTGIATENVLQPPWTGPGGAAYGSQLYIPVPGSAPPTAGVPQPTYAANVLGTDIYIGPINGEMPPWNGDFQLTTGYANLAISLGRRLQTTLGTLIYHSDFGSRIPPEVGNVQDDATAGHIASYGLSALMSDPRVLSVLSATATIVQPSGLGEVAFNGVVQPIGQGALGVSVNQVISPLA